MRCICQLLLFFRHLIDCVLIFKLRFTLSWFLVFLIVSSRLILMFLDIRFWLSFVLTLHIVSELTSAIHSTFTWYLLYQITGARKNLSPPSRNFSQWPQLALVLKMSRFLSLPLPLFLSPEVWTQYSFFTGASITY